MWTRVTTAAIRHAKFQSNLSPQTNQRPAFYRSDVLPVAQPTVLKHWKEEVSQCADLFTTSSPGDLPPLCYWNLLGRGGFQASRQRFDASTRTAFIWSKHCRQVVDCWFLWPFKFWNHNLICEVCKFTIVLSINTA